MLVYSEVTSQSVQWGVLLNVNVYRIAACFIILVLAVTYGSSGISFQLQGRSPFHSGEIWLLHLDKWIVPPDLGILMPISPNWAGTGQKGGGGCTMAQLF